MPLWLTDGAAMATDHETIRLGNESRYTVL